MDVILNLSCPECAAQMPDSASFCPGCGRRMTAPTRVSGTVGRIPESIAGGLAYLTFLPAVIFLLLDPYRRNRFVRFHSVQCLLLWLAAVITGAALRLVAVVLEFIPLVGPLLVWVLAVVAGLAAFFVWLALLVKALQGEMFKFAMLGDLAERYAVPSP